MLIKYIFKYNNFNNIGTTNHNIKLVTKRKKIGIYYLIQLIKHS